MRLGVDIVDLRETAGHNPRFANRVLSEREKQFVASQGDSTVWWFWAAKEAAFKAHSQGLKIPFHPSEWQVDLEAGIVMYQEHRFALKMRAEGNHVRAACVSSADLHQAAACVSSGDFFFYESLHHYPEACAPATQSADARALLKELCISTLGSNIHLNLDGIPRLDHRDAAVSMSHHGRWIYAALASSRSGIR